MSIGNLPEPQYQAALARERAWTKFLADTLATLYRRFQADCHGATTSPLPDAGDLADALGWLAYRGDPTLGIGRRDLEDRDGRPTPKRAGFVLAQAFAARPDWFRGAAACWVVERAREAREGNK